MSLTKAALQEKQGATVRMWLSVLTVSLGIFSMITAEQLPVGLIPAISSELNVSIGSGGLTVTIPGVIAAFASIGLPLAVGRLDRRILMAGLLAAMAAASVISALATNFPVLLASRLLVGITIGGFWAIAGSIAVRLVPGPSVPRAMTIVFGGVSAAAVLGVPAGTIIGDLVGWRGAFWSLAGLSFAILLAALLVLPKLEAAQPVEVKALRAQLRNPALLAGVVATALLVAAHYGAYTFVSPVLLEVSGVTAGSIGWLLLGYGILGMIGNAVAGVWAAKSVGRTLACIVIGLGATLALFPLLGVTPLTGTILLLVWGFAYGAAPITLQTWVLSAAPESAETATAIYCFTFNLAISVGTLATSQIVDTMGVNRVLWVDSAIILLVLLPVCRAPMLNRNIGNS
ncbi:MFS transporter [Mesorhizobium sp. M0761]|uniref:MFS transporter n=1 Tax=unclassified Mesorhizobium TaxID=325217 RepID=UPI0003CE3B45|nr:MULTISPECIES: MFS transporter [unclassified Mesorhizobium]ESX46195.1 transporter [Mesorhizobium sp. LSHC426A00]ESY23385.1 transporter [Mesorhizobium sp. LNJC394B00]ESZ77388.1 transporter [Mesorhizobium sp. L103C105A0]WJI62298.1 MFS transporter [Mesorhizobium sp. C416B]